MKYSTVKHSKIKGSTVKYSKIKQCSKIKYIILMTFMCSMPVHQIVLFTYVMNQQMHIYKYVRSHVAVILITATCDRMYCCY